MNFQPTNPEQALLMVFAIDYHMLMKIEGIVQTRSFLEHNETGLAYDDFVFIIRDGLYQPTLESFTLIKLAGSMLGVEYPNLCHPA